MKGHQNAAHDRPIGQKIDDVMIPSELLDVEVHIRAFWRLNRAFGPLDRYLDFLYEHNLEGVDNVGWCT